MSAEGTVFSTQNDGPDTKPLVPVRALQSRKTNHAEPHMIADYSVHLSQDEWDSQEVRGAWARLITECSYAGRLENSPEYLAHLRSTQDASQFHLVTIRDGAGSIVGIVPVHVMCSGLKFNVAGHVLAESRSRAVSILGSLPLLPADPVLHDRLFAALDEGFPSCDIIKMRSIPTNSFLWHYVRQSRLLQSRFILYLMEGVRGCHTVPLPETVQVYHSRLSAKRRYNLRRQARLLRDHRGGQLELRRFDSSRQVDDLVRIINGTRKHGGLRPWGSSVPLTIDRAEVESLASRDLLLIYVLIGAGRPCAALIGRQYRGVYYLEATPRDRSLDRFSPGSTAFNLVIEDLIRNTQIRRIDLGFGEPAHPHMSTNIVEPRASLLLMRKTLANRFWRVTHVQFGSLVDYIKTFTRPPR
jgi:CelD/BcsL family acetyltransferase involved in cellulose biosynthesis